MMLPGESLSPDDCIYSPSGNTALCMLTTGRLELRQVVGAVINTLTLWYSPDSPALANASLVMGSEGALQIVPLTGTCDSCETYMWRVSFTNDVSANVQLQVRDVCDFVLVSGGEVIWTSGTKCLSTDFASAVSLGMVLAVFVFSLLMVGIWAAIFLRGSACTSVLFGRRTTQPSPVRAVGSFDSASDFVEFQNIQLRGVLWPLMVIAFLTLSFNFALVATGVEPYYNYVRTSAGLIVFGLNFISFFVMNRAIQAARGRVSSALAKTLRIIFLFLGNCAITLTHIPMQHALINRVPLYDLLGPRVRCVNFLEMRMNDIQCSSQSDNINLLHVVNMLTHILFVLPVRQGCCYAVLSLCACMGKYHSYGVHLSNFDIQELLILSFALVLLLVGKGRLDHAQFEVFSELVARKQEAIQERVKRYQAEHLFDNMERRTRSSNDPERVQRDFDGASGGNSMPETTSTGLVFADLKPDHVADGMEEKEYLRLRLEEIARLCEHEGWLLKPSEVIVNPNEILGMGGFGRVISGKLHGTPVAVKHPVHAKPDGHQLKKQMVLVNELRLLRHVRHPNIVIFFGACIDPMIGMLLLVTERVFGVMLENFILQPRPGDEPFTKFKVILDIVNALRYLHSQSPQIVHSDLKPGNIIVEPDVPQARLLDFGLSRMLTRSAKSAGGTLSWMAPELIRNSDATPKASSDVFSFGLLVYMIIARQRPLSSMDMRTIALSGQSVSLNWPSGVDLLTESKRLSERALEAEPMLRPSMADLHIEISSWPVPVSLARKRIIDALRVEEREPRSTPDSPEVGHTLERSGREQETDRDRDTIASFVQGAPGCTTVSADLGRTFESPGRKEQTKLDRDRLANVSQFEL